MKNYIIKKIFNGLIYIHILHHGNEGAFYGTWMIKELKEHGYSVSPGTLYPILKLMEEDKLLEKQERNINGKIRKYYKTTNKGKELLLELKGKLKELFIDMV